MALHPSSPSRSQAGRSILPYLVGLCIVGGFIAKFAAAGPMGLLLGVGLVALLTAVSLAAFSLGKRIWAAIRRLWVSLPPLRSPRVALSPTTAGLLAGAGVIAAGIVAAAGVSSYFSPYQSCVRAAMDGYWAIPPNPEVPGSRYLDGNYTPDQYHRFANVRCAMRGAE